MRALYGISGAVLAGLATLNGCDTKTGSSNPTPAEQRAQAPRTGAAPDNTANNKGDGSAATKTPPDQAEGSAAIRITAEIRRAIIDDKNLSTNAHNCKIITEPNGVVTLRGVVNSQAERDAVEAKAKAVAGVTRIDNQLEIKTN